MVYASRWLVRALACCACLGWLGCEPYDPPAAGSGVFESCCDGQGTCVPEGLVETELSERLTQDSCVADLLCAPTALATGAALVACRADGDLEGRCAPSCLPEVFSQSARLSQGACADGQLCLPCFDPRNGEATGVCSFGGDRPHEPAKRYPRCCEGRGTCVPPRIIPTDDRVRLAADSCEQALCVPSAWLEDERPPPESCRADGDLEGRCLPTCLHEIAKRADQLVQGSCAAGSLCSPCYDPRTGEATGACDTEGDRPRDRPKQFARCCEGSGRCVPAQSVPAADRGRLAAADCRWEGELCAPSEWLDDPRPAPKSCRAVGDREGRCLSSCLPDVADRAERLTRGSCAEQQLCVPCFDPLTGEDTKVCRIYPDPGPSEEARPLGGCCEGLGRCVPPELVASDERERLAADSCTEAGALCVPSAWLSEPRPAPASCRAPGDLEGRCFPSCLPEVSSRAKQLTQSNCAAHQLCLPCFDPLSSEDTQACRLPGDAGPVDAPRQFELCCGEIGRCLPRSAVDSAAQASFGRDSCRSEFEALCVPSAWIAGQAPMRCTAAGDLEGRCLPSCLPQVASQGDKVQRADCPAQYACLPCFDPLSGAATGACELAGDSGPHGPAREFPACCGQLGRCVPTDTIAASDRARLGRDSCKTSFESLCVPSAWIEGQAPARCRAPGDLEGRCFPSCLPQVAEQGDKLRRADCPAQHACLPCFDPLTGQATGACQLPGDTGPSEPPRVFERCCSAGNSTLGTCLPNALLPRGQTAPAPPQPLCAPEFSCVPDALVRTPEVGLRACTSGVLSTARGACVPECLLGDTASLLVRDTCGQAQRCAPCSQLGLETPACE